MPEHNSQENADKLGEGEERYRVLIENAAEVILVAQDGQFKFINGRSLDLLGYRPEELIGKPFIDYIHPEDRKLVGERHVQRLKGENPPNNYTFRVIDKDSQTKWVQISAIKIDWLGKPATLNYLTDITETKRIENEKQIFEARYKIIFDSSNDIMVQIDPAGTIIDINKTAETRGGYKKDELIGQKISALAGKFTAQSIVQMVANFAKRKLGLQVGPYEAEAIDSAGQKLIVEINAVPLKDSAGKNMGELAVLHDITERKQATDELANKVKELEKITKIMEGREDRILELKQRIKELEVGMK